MMTKNFYIAAFVVSMLAFSSCKIGKRYARPELNLPDRIEAYTDTTDTASVENIPWESLYADETLKDLIKKALDNNKDMKIAAAKVKEMIAAKRISFANMLPEVGANIYAQKERLNYGGDDPKPDPEFGAKLTLSWELDLWGNLRWANHRFLYADRGGAACLAIDHHRRGSRQLLSTLRLGPRVVDRTTNLGRTS